MFKSISYSGGAVVRLFFLIIAFYFLPAKSFVKKNMLKTMVISSIGVGKSLIFTVDVDLPDGQKINTGADSYISVFERKKGEWALIKKININNKILFSGADLFFSEKLSLDSDHSKLAIDSTIFHCAINNRGQCYIDNFQKTILRYKKEGKGIALKLLPTKD